MTSLPDELRAKAAVMDGDASQLEEQLKHLEERLAYLKDSSRKLREAADVYDVTDKFKSGTNGHPKIRTESPRIMEVREYLRKNGPKSRQEIMAALPDIPKGTMNVTLTAKLFVKNDQGMWTADKPSE